jgi:SAM-dependent methyltransferase
VRRDCLNIGCGRDVKLSTATQRWFNLDNIKETLPLPPEANYLNYDLESPARGGMLIPFPDNVFELVHASHVLEHIHGLLPLVQDIWRVLKPGGLFTVRVPYAFHSSAFEDPTHCRYFVPTSFIAFTQAFYWRGDYGYRGDFNLKDVTLLVDPAYKDMPAKELIQRARHNINVGVEIIAKLTAVKPIRAPDRKYANAHVNILLSSAE